MVQIQSSIPDTGHSLRTYSCIYAMSDRYILYCFIEYIISC